MPDGNLPPLDPEQRAAMTVRPNSRSVIIAGAGTGKTLTLTARAAYVRKFSSNVEGTVLCLSYTNKASEEIGSRLADFINGPRCVRSFAKIEARHPGIRGRFWNGTIHSCAKHVIEEICAPRVWQGLARQDRTRLSAISDLYETFVENYGRVTNILDEKDAADLWQQTVAGDRDLGHTFLAVWKRRREDICGIWNGRQAAQMIGHLVPPAIRHMTEPEARRRTWEPFDITDLEEHAGSLYQIAKMANGVVDYNDLLTLSAAALTYVDDLRNYYRSQISHVLVDECLPYKTPVLLADGTSMPIGEIVEKKLPVSVLGYDTVTGRQRSCKVTGWSKTPSRKPLVCIRTKRMKPCKWVSAPDYNFVVCTTDHKIWADGRWIPAGEIKPGMTVQVETSAKKTHTYKIASKGKTRLSSEMSAKNDAGTCGFSRAGGKPEKRGGNGKALPEPQQFLVDQLGKGWVSEYVLKTGMKVLEGHGKLPHHYKIDIACPDQKIAVEVDGKSHQTIARKKQDDKKTAYLEAKGWKVKRVTNSQAIRDAEEVVRELRSWTALDDCPVDALVTKVEETTIPENFVYDITVEDCHDFYANGILVHNCQDITFLDYVFLKSLPDFLPQGSNDVGYTLVGDPRQEIYDWKAGQPGLFHMLTGTGWADSIQHLSTNYRSGPQVVGLASKIAQNPALYTAYEQDPRSRMRTRRGAPDSAVTWTVTARNEGVENYLPAVIRASLREDYNSRVMLVRSNWMKAPIEKVLSEIPGASRRFEVSTIHSAKGKEWDHVVLTGLGREKFPTRQNFWRTLEQHIRSESRVLYVAVTRARRKLEVFETENGAFYPAVYRQR